jgi:AbrB family looped-hinge helix DNA binding protein
VEVIKGESTVSEKGQLVIPREIRQALDVQRGDKLAWVMGDDGILRVTVAKGDLMALRGKIRSGGRSVSVEEMDEAVKAGAVSE